jgi:hypothetical protein
LARQQKEGRPSIVTGGDLTFRNAEGIFAMTDLTHKFKIGQTVELIPSTFRSAARGNYEIVSLRPSDGGNPQYWIKSRSENHQRVASESDLILLETLKSDFH